MKSDCDAFRKPNRSSLQRQFSSLSLTRWWKNETTNSKINDRHFREWPQNVWLNIATSLSIWWHPSHTKRLFDRVYCLLWDEYWMICLIIPAIVRYLAGRFPETTTAADENGRTALHYAATVKDNGHFFNLLVHLGANPKAVDTVIHCVLVDCVVRCFKKILFHFSVVPSRLCCARWIALQLGHSAEYYMQEEESNSILSHVSLLKAFGAHENLVNEMLNDQGS